MFAVEKFGAKDYRPKQGSEIFRPTFFDRGFYRTSKGRSTSAKYFRR